MQASIRVPADIKVCPLCLTSTNKKHLYISNFKFTGSNFKTVYNDKLANISDVVIGRTSSYSICQTKKLSFASMI